MPPELAQRMGIIRPFEVMALLARARELEARGRDIVHMEIGEPDFDTARPIIDAGVRALAAGKTHYTPAAGLPALREAIAGFYHTRYAVDLDPRRILITPGASGALQLLLGVLIDPGHKVMMSDPGYPCNRNFVTLYGGDPRLVPVTADSHYQLTAGLAETHWEAAVSALLVASPANPTGTLLSREALGALAELTAARGCRLIVDEIYHGLTYGSAAPSILQVTDRAFVINSFSKYFGMTGWRLGWIVAPEEYVEPLERLAQNLFLAAPTPAQWAALAAFEPETLAIFEDRRAEFQRRRDYLLPALRALGFNIPLEPEGAFYLYADCSAFTDDSFQFVTRLLEEAGVAVTPGKDFGHFRAAQHVRIAYTTALERLEEGVERIRAWLGENPS